LFSKGIFYLVELLGVAFGLGFTLQSFCKGTQKGFSLLSQTQLCGKIEKVTPNLEM